MGLLHVQAKSFESLAVESTDLRFPPPLAERGSNPEGFDYWWKMMEFVFALPEPSSFPPFLTQSRKKERELLERFIAATAELAESTLLNSSDGVTVHIPDEPGEAERVETSFTSKELQRGFIILFRQIHSNEKSDPARFQRVLEVLKDMNARAEDDSVAERDRQIKAWAQARGRLLRDNLKVLVGEKLAKQQRWPADGIPGKDGMSPQQLISGYQYGDLIHWGYGRDVLEAVADDPFDQAWQQMAFFEAVTGLAHLYIGFSLLVKAALDSEEALDPAGSPAD